MQIMNDRGHATLLVHRNTLHGLASCRPRSRSNVLRLQRKDTSSCDRGASAMIRQRFDPEGTSWQISWATQEPRTRPQVRCQAEQQQQEEQEQTLPQRDPATTTRPLQGVRIVPTAAALFALGAVLGPPLDSLHSGVNLLIYDKFPVTIGSWRTSLADAPLLGAYYAVAGLLLLALDDVWGTTEDKRRIAARTNPGWVALSFGLLVAYLSWSSKLYAAGMPYEQIWAVLLVVGVSGWWSIDSTRQGLALALVSAAVCPLAEILLMDVAGLWHYPQADFMGITSWVACCYAFYTVVVGNLARWLAVTLSKEE